MTFDRLPRPALPLAAALLITLAGCQTGGEVHMQPPPELAATARLKVEGLVGWLPGRQLRYGPYRIEAFKPGPVKQRTDECRQRACWSAGSLKFDNAVTTSQQRLQFRQLDARGQAADVRALADWQVARESWAIDLFGLPYRETQVERPNVFFGTVVPEAADEPGWRFWLSDRDDATATIGLAQDDDGRRWEIRGTQGMVLPPAAASAALPRIMAQMRAGLVLHDGNRAIAAVDQVVGGHVWIADDLPAHHKLAAASITSALLLRGRAERKP